MSYTKAKRQYDREQYERDMAESDRNRRICPGYVNPVRGFLCSMFLIKNLKTT